MRKRTILLGILVSSGLATAGAKQGLSVTIGSTYAWGSMGDARSSPDNAQSIGCYSVASATLRYGNCYAHDDSTAYKSCRTYDLDLISVIESVGSDSVIEFTVDGSTCKSITVTNDSRFKPRLP